MMLLTAVFCAEMTAGESVYMSSQPGDDWALSHFKDVQHPAGPERRGSRVFPNRPEP